MTGGSFVNIKNFKGMTSGSFVNIKNFLDRILYQWVLNILFKPLKKTNGLKNVIKKIEISNFFIEKSRTGRLIFSAVQNNKEKIK